MNIATRAHLFIFFSDTVGVSSVKHLQQNSSSLNYFPTHFVTLRSPYTVAEMHLRHSYAISSHFCELRDSQASAGVAVQPVSL